MKKLFCTLLVLSLLLAFAACSTPEPQMVTIYLPDTITAYNPDGTVAGTAQIVYEEGWETKESFTAQAVAQETENQVAYTITYGDKYTLIEYSELLQTEFRFDENGRQISQTVQLAETSGFDKTETIYSYDEKGRQLTQETKTYYKENDQVASRKINFTYIDTADGCEGTDSSSSTTSILRYDKNNRLVCMISMVYGQESSCVEYTYDAHGNQICSVVSQQGQVANKTETTYKAVEVSSETAARLPQFVRVK